MRAVSGNYYPCTDDGSYGHAGMVTTMVEELVEAGQSLRCLYRYRTDDHDEICMSPDEKACNPDCC